MTRAGNRGLRSFCLGLAACLACLAITASAQTAVSPTPSPTATPESLSAHRAESERSRMYKAGLAYSKWLDRGAEASGSRFLQELVFDRVTWMRLLACAGSLAVLRRFHRLVSLVR